MNRFLSSAVLWLVLLTSLTTFGQTSFTITLPGSIPDTAWVQRAIKNAKFGTIVPVVPVIPIVKTDSCKAGPVITNITNVSPTYLNGQFHGENVIEFAWQIKNASGEIIRTGEIRPVNNNPGITYNSLTAGTYTLIYTGKSCLSKTSSKPFIISGNLGVKDPLVVPDQWPATVETVVKKIVSGLPSNMNIYFHVGSDGKRYFSDSANNSPPDGYEFWYGINDHIVKQGTSIKNFAWPYNTPLGVWKAMGKKGLDTFARWTGDTDSWFDANAGAAFSYNESYPNAAFFFEPSNSGYDVSRNVVHWMDVLPKMQLPQGNIWIMPIGPISTPDEVLSHGVTHFSKYEAAGRPEWDQLQKDGKLYDEVPKTDQQFGLRDYGQSNWVPKGKAWPEVWNERYFGPLQPGQTEPLTYEQGKEAGRRYTVSFPVVVFENSEQDHAISAHWPFIRGFYETFIPRMDAEWLPKGIKPLVAHNYFTGFGGGALSLGDVGRQANKDILRNVGAWPRGDLSAGGTLEKTTAVCFGLYLGPPDQTAKLAYQLIFSAEVAKIGGKPAITFAQPFSENRPNNFIQDTFPEGKFYRHAKQGWNPAQGINYSFLAQTFTAGFVPFMAASKTDGHFRYDREYRGPGSLWLPKGTKDYASLDTFPHWKKYGQNEAYPGGQAEHYIALGVQKYVNTFAKTKGGIRAFLTYRIDGGEWVKAVNRDLDDVVDAFYDKTGFVYSEEKDGLLAVFYLNSFADTKLHKLEYEHRGKIYSMTIHSTIVHPVLHSL